MNNTAGETASFRSQLGPVAFLAVLFLINFTSRIILSPLLPTIEKELALSHGQAGFLFFLSSVGYLGGLISSGLLASRSTHKFAIAASIAGVGAAMLVIAAAQASWQIRGGLFGLGFAAGLYLPSAIATITSLVDRRHWGKAIGVHELAPNLAFFLSPFIAELFLKWSGWRGALGTLGALALIASASFSRFGRGGAFPGESLASPAFGALARTAAFWLMVVLFALGVSSTIGVYAMLPLYLIAERKVEPTWANTIVALSRSHGPILGLLGGWASDKLGAKQTIVISLTFTGVVTFLLGPLSGTWLNIAVVLQPLLAVWFFPAAFAAIAMIMPAKARNVAVAFSVPFGFVIGAGVIPTFIGAMGDDGAFALGFALTGALIACGGLLAMRLRLPSIENQR
ncbi:MAG TPA: MFS transporter [Candidatus Binatia bacterium]|jgi:NNP family nitrate/nitrite transporter-like MFS transporter